MGGFFRRRKITPSCHFAQPTTVLSNLSCKGGFIPFVSFCQKNNFICINVNGFSFCHCFYPLLVPSVIYTVLRDRSYFFFKNQFFNRWHFFSLVLALPFLTTLLFFGHKKHYLAQHVFGPFSSTQQLCRIRVLARTKRKALNT